ncbi:hypothetical protein O6H91_01G025100 [Diphasiastrum complanatum]|uniref:Uncharacterized protein n=1 Tax=Diphasiastrum complanatum TaxID=34168 RepID=A0ACC2EPA9_DIPCM|nr:hypothetical protein O6H91_01G025100 [Diphasiastrum complanatum]
MRALKVLAICCMVSISLLQFVCCIRVQVHKKISYETNSASLLTATRGHSSLSYIGDKPFPEAKERQSSLGYVSWLQTVSVKLPKGRFPPSGPSHGGNAIGTQSTVQNSESSTKP